MPIYTYRCKSCNEEQTHIHKMGGSAPLCSVCNEDALVKTVASTTTKINTTLESQKRLLKEQHQKDYDRFMKDDNFAANITGYDDKGSEERKRKLREAEHKKNEAARKKIKRSK